ncbi:hypothetical protein GCM10010249_30910 [Streptomyces roseolilacinus]|uniref:Uncharacterized protein n=1 Tax=Streptomyces roseolilacinus TaxID=66904 RepID=A0A918B0B1_9ACTN|nr:hypothetical protein GCM10010249_30910 [Streptomyces roseolilacinus]
MSAPLRYGRNGSRAPSPRRVRPPRRYGGPTRDGRKRDGPRRDGRRRAAVVRPAGARPPAGRTTAARAVRRRATCGDGRRGRRSTQTDLPTQADRPTRGTMPDTVADFVP